MNKALICVDVQNDFLPGGALGVTDGHRATPLLWRLMDEVDVIVFTRDWHPGDHASFAKGTPAYTDMSWPPHCVAGTEGAEIDEWLWDKAMDTGKPTLLVHKGFEQDKEAYSGFQGVVVDAFNFRNWDQEAAFKDGTATLAEALNSLNVTHVKIGGLALDYCVKATAIDSRSHFGDTTVYLDATRPVAYLTGVQAVADLAAAGVRLDSREF